MREVINISLPKSMADQIRLEVKKNDYASVSEFIRHLIRSWNTQKLALELENDQKEFKKGKSKELKSLKDLI